MKLLVINGPNLNNLGNRNQAQYGNFSMQDLEKALINEFPEIKLEFLQSNHEGEIIDAVQKSASYFDGIVINPAGYSHSSVSIRDAIEECSLPVIEVHISKPFSREDFRHTHITAEVCDGYFSGMGILSYKSAIFALKKSISEGSFGSAG